MTPDNDHGRVWRRMTPSQAASIASAHRSHVPVALLASEYGVSTRTIYRTVQRARCPWVRVVVGDWWAEFAVDEEGPTRMTRWYAA